MQCPRCSSDHIKKNGHSRKGKQNHLCKDCGAAFVEESTRVTEEEKATALRLYQEGLSIRAVARLIGRGHVTVWTFLKKSETRAASDLMPN
jgi:transposase-like protein